MKAKDPPNRPIDEVLINVLDEHYLCARFELQFGRYNNMVEHLLLGPCVARSIRVDWPRKTRKMLGVGSLNLSS